MLPSTLVTKIPLPLSFYQRSTKKVAKELLGLKLCVKRGRKIYAGYIVETEAYLGVNDRACHSFGGRRTARTEPMYANGGQVYVYFIYGMFFCVNVVTEKEGCPEAILIRALQPLDGKEDIRKYSGPGKLCRELQIDKKFNAYNFNSAKIWIEEGVKIKPSQILASSRVGIASAEEAVHWPLRFTIKDHPSVSKKLPKVRLKTNTKNEAKKV